MNRRDFIKYGTVLAGVGGVCFLCKNQNCFTEKTVHDDIIKDTRPCKMPFVFCEILENGDVSPCCPAFLKYKSSFGNIENEDFDKIWNGKIYTDLRQRVLNGDYSMCNRGMCMYSPCSVDEIPADYKRGPKELKISYDFECNYNCITCRDTIRTNSAKETELYNNVYLPKIIQIAKNTEIVDLLGSGDPLFSRHSKHLMKELIKAYPKIKFNLSTNGFLLDPKTLSEIGIQNNIRAIFVSVDAANRETYKQILRADAFDRVMKNIELMSEWRKQGKIKWITMNFVVHLMNYKEMPDFVKMAQKLDIMAFFSTYQPWISAEYHKRYDEVAVFEPKNKHYKELVEILHNPVFKDKEHCSMEQRLFDIVNS